MAPGSFRYGVLRCLMVFLSSVILISGLVLFCLGAWIKFGAASFIEVMGSFSGELLTSIYINMGVGSALCLLGLLGCCGACTHNRCLILLYFVILSVMFIGQMVCTILVLLYKDVVTAMIQAASKESLMTMYMGPAATDPISKAWNSIMTKYKCCGFENSTQDFRSSIFATNTGLLYPKTCCVDMKSPACDGLDTTPSLIHQKSCMRRLIEVIKDKSVIIGIIATYACAMQLASMTISVVMFVRLRAGLC